MKGFIIYPTYRQENGTATVMLFGRTEDGKSFLTRNTFRPYFFIKQSDLAKAKKLGTFDSEETGLKNFDEEIVAKIILDLPRDVPTLRRTFEDEGIPTYEADIRFAYRFMMDHDLLGCVDIQGNYKKEGSIEAVYDNPALSAASYIPELNVFSFDIETSMDGKQLYSIACYTDSLRKVLMISDKDVKGCTVYKHEKDLLQGFIDLVQAEDPDVITGWNVVDFDLAFLKKKCEEHKVPFQLGRIDWETKLRINSDFFRDSTADVAGRMVLDGISLLKSSFIKLRDYKLSTAAQKFLGEGKLLGDEGRFNEITRLFKEDKKSLGAYNLKDAELAYRILEESGIFKLAIQRSILTGMPLDRVKASIASLDSLYLRELRKRGYVAQTGVFVEKENPITGGYVMQSKPGIYDYVLVLDFKSLYPSIMRTFNIDPLMFVRKKPKDKQGLIEAPNGALFRKEEGILPQLLQRLWKARDQAKKEKNAMASLAIKILMNSFFGVMASPNCRFFSMELANAITTFGQHTIKLAVEEIEKLGYDVIYGDSLEGSRCVTILDTDGLLKVIPIAELFNQYSEQKIFRRGKEIIRLTKGPMALSIDKQTLKSKFSPIKALIRHETHKKMYRINQKYGETICTEDHSIMVRADQKLKPCSPLEIFKLNRSMAAIADIPPVKKIRKIDLYQHLKDYSFVKRYKGKDKIVKTSVVDRNWISFSWMNMRTPVLLKRYITIPSVEMEALCRLLGIYIAEGSSSTPESTSRMGASISSSMSKTLLQAKRDYETLFKNVKPSIIMSQARLYRQIESGTKTSEYMDATMKLQMMNGLSAVFFKMLAGQKSRGKKIPEFMYHVPKKYQKILIDYMVIGDGNRYDQRCTKEFVTKNFRYDTNSLCLISGLSLLLKQNGIVFNIHYRPSKGSYRLSTSKKHNCRLNTKLTTENRGGFVYDLSVEDEIFVDSCGQLLVHNTDSCFVNVQVTADKEADVAGKKIEKEINVFFGDHIPRVYGVTNYLDLEYEKMFRKFWLPSVRGKERGSKKRYAGLRLVDGKEKIDFTGLEFVRRDWTALAKKFQLSMIERVFHDKPLGDYIKRFIEDLKAGKMDDLLVYRKALRKKVSEYTKTTPPHVKAARQLKKIDSTIIEYLMTQNGPEPVSMVKNPIDYEHYIDKQLKPLAESILMFTGEKFDDFSKNTKQTGLGDF